VETASRFGIDRSRAQNYHDDSAGSAVVYEAVTCAAIEFRQSEAPLSDDWKKEVEADYKRRGG
jgi:hypothetical protein